MTYPYPDEGAFFLVNSCCKGCGGKVVEAEIRFRKDWSWIRLAPGMCDLNPKGVDMGSWALEPLTSTAQAMIAMASDATEEIPF